MSEPASKSILPAGRLNHVCDHEGCNEVAPFGFNKRYGMEFYCSEHKEEGSIGSIPRWVD